MTPLPARLVHNDKLGREFFAKHKITSAVPAVSRQIASQVVNPMALSPWGYNPSIIRFNGKLLMAYRWHDEKDLSTSLAMAELNDQLQVTNNAQIEIPLHPPWDSAEDPRMFLWKDELWMSWIESDFPKRPCHCVVKYGHVKGGPPWSVEWVKQVKYGKNDGSALEKNWVFGSYSDGNLYCFYNSTTILQIDGEAVVDEKHLPAYRWPWGPIKGGTFPAVRDNGMVRFFHSSLDFDPPPNRRRYYIGAARSELGSSEVHVSTRPIAIGSEDDNLAPEHREKCIHFKPKVVFPGGAIEWQGGWLLSCGINDCQCLLLKVMPEDLHL